MMANYTQILDQAEEQCRRRGARLTPKRKKVLLGLLLSERAMSAYELIDFCREELGASLPAMSMYRILDFLQSEHLAHRLASTNKYIACGQMRRGDQHELSQFLICDQCQKVKEVSVSQSAMDELQKSLTSSGFRLVGTQLEINCICAECASSSSDAVN